MYRFMRTPKWILGHVIVVSLLVTFVAAGLWQLRRLDEVRAQSAVFTERAVGEPRPLGEVLAAADGDPAELAYQRVRVTGSYLADYGTATAPTSRDGTPGTIVLTPLAPADGGTAVLVERGTVPYRRDGVPASAAPPPGEVTVTGLLLPPDEVRGDRAVNEAGYVTAITPSLLAPALGLPLEPVALRLLTQDPPVGGGVAVGAVPSFDAGNHLSYAFQWFSFAAIAVIGYPILVVRTARERAHGDQDLTTSRPAGL